MIVGERRRNNSGAGSGAAGLPPGQAARRLAWRQLVAASRGRLLSGADFAQAGLEPEDRAFARMIVWSTLRHQGELGHLLGELCRGRRVPLPLRCLLQSGMVQILRLRVPDHAAVHQTVQLARTGGWPGMAGLVNAVLRETARSGAQRLAGLDPYTLNVPEGLRTSWQAAWGEEAARRIAAAQLTQPALDLGLRDGGADAVAGWLARFRAAGLRAQPLPDAPMIRLEATGQEIPSLPGYQTGAWWVQDYGAAQVMGLLGSALEGVRIIDLCAAPGGKTARMLAMGARVAASELHPQRWQRLHDNLQRLRLTERAELFQVDGRQWEGPGWQGGADMVLVDPPCTGTGTIRRHPEILLRGRAGLDRLVALQRQLLDRAVQLVRPGGRVLYSVCSLEPEEGEAQFSGWLRAHPGLRAVRVAHPFGQAAGEGLAWLPDAGPGMDGFFAGMAEKTG